MEGSAMTRIHWFMLMALMVAVAGCSSGDQGGEGEPALQEQAQEVATGEVQPTMTVEVGCGMCTYSMDGVESCTPAAKVGDQAVLITGVDIDAHALGLCSAPKQAVVTGTMEEGTLVATNIEFE
jgi:hypothetical protein